jgi:hypothetical protein
VSRRRPERGLNAEGLCGRDANEDLSVVLGLDDDRWPIDLCHADDNRIAGQFDQWVIVDTSPSLRWTSTHREHVSA